MENQLQPLQEFQNIGHNIPAVRPVSPIESLRIEDAPYIGFLWLDLIKKFPQGNSISYEPFVSGNQYIRLEGNDNYIFAPETLQETWDTGRYINPLTNKIIQQDDIERFTYKYEPEAEGGKRSKISKKAREFEKARTLKKARKSKKARISKKTRKSKKGEDFQKRV